MAPVAAPKSVELFNAVAALQLGDVEQAMQLRFQLMQLLKKHPGDPMLRIALIDVCRVAGFREEAMEHVAIAGSLLRSAVLPGRLNYASALVRLGRSNQAVPVISDILDAGRGGFSDAMKHSAAATAFFAGDVPLLERLAALEIPGETGLWASDILELLDDLKLRSALSDFQRAILDLVADVQMDAMFKLAEHPDDGRPYLSLRLYVDASKIHRLDIADALHQRLDRVFAEFPDIRDDWWWRLIVTVHGAPRHASLSAAPRVRLVA